MVSNGLKVVTMRTDELVPYAGNAKEHPEWHVSQIADSIDQFGFNDPIGVWHDPQGNPVIVEGHGRLLAARHLGMREVPVVFLDHLDDEGRRAYTLVHNQLTMNTGFDFGVLDAELAKIADIDMSQFGFDDSEEFVSEVVEADELEREMAAREEGEVPFTEYVDEASNYVVLKFSTEGDWLRAVSVLGIGTVRGLSTGRDGNSTFTGTGRVMDGNRAFELIGRAEAELSR